MDCIDKFLHPYETSNQGPISPILRVNPYGKIILVYIVFCRLHLSTTRECSSRRSVAVTSTTRRLHKTITS
ncbi:hypothetical protein RCL_jg26238.t1 [Rhizophagus clarus]|uniref:Uncharacterized protein n=1 Tax=Rhizophagus clarus TaxID=94130 RepID=A0A8H3KUV1_9GLOM|nr:hypothetical protein RCL_jg26238.t1 [Rhizophagus clarus]